MNEPKSTALSAEEMRGRHALRGSTAAPETINLWDTRPLDAIVKQVAEALANDRENKYRLALIELGWTPPPQ